MLVRAVLQCRYIFVLQKQVLLTSNNYVVIPADSVMIGVLSRNEFSRSEFLIQNICTQIVTKDYPSPRLWKYRSINKLHSGGMFEDRGLQ